MSGIGASASVGISGGFFAGGLTNGGVGGGAPTGKYNVLQNGIAANGVAGNVAALIALAAILPAAGATLYWPAGAYRIDGDVTLPSNITHEFAPAAVLTIDNGRTLTINGPMIAPLSQIFAGAGSVAFSPSRVPEVYPEWWGAFNDGTNAAATTAALQAAYNTRLPIRLSTGTYLFNTLVADGQPLLMSGSGEKSVLQTTATAAIGIAISQTASSEGTTLRDFRLIGTATNAGGIALGTAAQYAAFTLMERVRIDSFTGVGAYGISLNSVQELHCHDCRIQSNYNNVYRPNLGYCTSTLFSGMRGYIGRATNIGALLSGLINDISFDSIVIEDNVKDGIRAVGFASLITIVGCYFEANCGGGGATVTVGGAAGANARLNLTRSHFHIVDGANPGAAQLSIDYTSSSFVGYNDGIFSSGGIVTTANTVCEFRNNYDPDTAQNPIGIYTVMLGKITSSDLDSTQSRFETGDRIFHSTHLKSVQAAAPAIAVNGNAGAGASVAIVGTDMKGRITLNTGGSGWGAGTQLTVTFSRAYGSIPRVQLTPRNANAASAFSANQAFVAEDTAGDFLIQFGIAATAAKAYIWDYFVTE